MNARLGGAEQPFDLAQLGVSFLKLGCGALLLAFLLLAARDILQEVDVSRLRWLSLLFDLKLCCEASMLVVYQALTSGV